MKPELKTRWVEALRSGKYKQGTSYLNRNGNLCCLGVACEVFAEDVGLKKRVQRETVGFTPNIVRYGDQTCQLPTSIGRLLDIDCVGTLSRPIAASGGGSDWYNLVHLNDKARYTFDQIADVIEKEF